MQARSVGIVLLVVLAGCSLPISPDTATGDDWTGDPDNPWQEETLTVAIDGSADESRDYRPMVREALDYWEANAERYAGYPIAYEIRPDAADPDLEVRVVESIDRCGTGNRSAGCAPIVTNRSVVSRPALVRVQGNFTHESTVRVLKHEIGHTLGLGHGDEPADVMQHRSQLSVLPMRNATDRAMPWRDPELSVFVDESNVSAGEREETRRQVAAALGYAADGADGTLPDDVSFTRTDDRDAADVVVVFADSDGCTSGAGSCRSLQGTDPDGDGALEWYTHLEVTLVDVDTEARGWHVGYWLVRGFGRTGDELPEPLRTDDPDVRRSDWWE
jgi:hypothetical protein